MNRKTRPFSFPPGFAEVADHIAIVADTIVLRALKECRIDKVLKPNGTVVTTIDKQAEAALIDRLSEVYPSASFICEETASGHDRWDRYHGIECENGHYVLAPEGKLVLIDPLCGSMNVPNGPFGMMVGVFERGKALGVWSYDPLRRVFLYASDEVTTHTVCVSRTGGFSPARSVSMPKRCTQETSLHFFILGEHQDPLRHLTAAHKTFGKAVTWFREAKTTFSASASTHDMLLRGSVGAAAYTVYLTPWDLFNLAFLVEKAGGATVTLDGKPYTSCGAKGVVTARSHNLAQNIVYAIHKAQRAEAG